MITSKKIQAGDKVAAITLSWGGPGVFKDRYEIGKKQFEDTFNVEVIETEHALKDEKWIYDNPKARAEDLMWAFSDKSIKAIISTIGGDESVRILPYIDLNVIRNNPKIFMGFSDTTITHFVCFKAGITSFYGPSFMTELAENTGMFPYTINSIWKTLFSNEVIGEIKPNINGWTSEFLDWAIPENQNIKRKLNKSNGWKFLQGNYISRGRLIGGCIEVMEFLKGTRYWPDMDEWKNTILFLETSEEAPSVKNFKRWLRNYGTQGILHLLSGIIMGRPGGNIPESEFILYEEALLDVIGKELGLVNLSVITNMDFGHTAPSFVIPYGIEAEINCLEKKFSILENSVI